MQDILYTGEHTLIGQLGHGLVILSFISALLAGIYFFKAHQKGEGSIFQGIAKKLFSLHFFSLIGVVLVLFYMLVNQYFEYDYVYKHSNKAMPLRYIFSCFWEGQEGSFLLWLFWNGLLGFSLFFGLRKSKHLNLALLIFSLVQVFIASMLLGVYVFGHKIGSSPFVLVRELSENYGMPWTLKADYLNLPLFQDGRGLNPLLQNYWMTIHPPTLFLGFASTLIPFSLGLSGLFQRDHQGWIKTALPYTYFSIAVLGLGILMGGAWAYEALSFGGFWAWDPVENASLVPWLTLLAGAHIMLIQKQKPNSVFTSYLFVLISFLLVLYSTFLVRSGVLGDTSVHSFTDNGMTGQLLIYLFFFITLCVSAFIYDKGLRYAYWGLSAAIGLLGLLWIGAASIVMLLVFNVITLWLAHRKYFSSEEVKDNLFSREFWMFIGALVLIMSAVQISISTSIPVINKLLQPFSGFFAWLYDSTNIAIFQKMAAAGFAPPSDAITHYNKWQIPLVVLLMLFIAVSHYLNFRESDKKKLLKDFLLGALVSIVLTSLVSYYFNFKWQEINYILLLFTSFLAIAAVKTYWFKLKFSKLIVGSTIAHIGFALLVLGALISTGKSVKISENTSGINIKKLNDEFNNNEEILLFKGDTLFMDKYFIHYKDKEKGSGKDSINIYYTVEYFGLGTHVYKPGQNVIVKGVIFQCVTEHQPTENFVADQANWREIPNPTLAEIQTTKIWNPYGPGDKLFELHPRIQMNPIFGNVAEPSTKHYLDEDIYTHIRWAELEEAAVDAEGYLPEQDHELQVGDTISASKSIIVFERLQRVGDSIPGIEPEDIAAQARLKVVSSQAEYFAEPIYILKDTSGVALIEAKVEEAGLKFALTQIDPSEGHVHIAIAEKEANKREFIVMQAIVFPGINILWLGCILMTIGTLIAVIQRIAKGRVKTN